MKENYWLAIDYIGRGFSTERARIMVSGMGGHVYCTTSKNNGVVEGRARRWAKRKGITLPAGKIT